MIKSHKWKKCVFAIFLDKSTIESKGEIAVNNIETKYVTLLTLSMVQNTPTKRNRTNIP